LALWQRWHETQKSQTETRTVEYKHRTFQISAKASTSECSSSEVCAVQLSRGDGGEVAINVSQKFFGFAALALRAASKKEQK
jgi:hypothetical protein